MEGEHGLLFHLKCFKFMELRQGLVDAITNGGQRQCPKCGDAGTKDNACTHMTCDNCKAVYCYVCEQSADKVDVEGGESCTAEGTSRLYKHNENWKTNEKRCPMYLEYIKGIDKRWPSGAEESLEYFHKLLTLSNLKGFIEKHGESKFEKLVKRFNNICHFSLQEIKAIDARIIIREKPKKLKKKRCDSSDSSDSKENSSDSSDSSEDSMRNRRRARRRPMRRRIVSSSDSDD